MQSVRPETRSPVVSLPRATVSNAAVVIPARIGSQRLPGKVLADVAGRPLMCWTAEMASRSCVGAENVFIATGDEAVAQAAAECFRKLFGPVSGRTSGDVNRRAGGTNYT